MSNLFKLTIFLVALCLLAGTATKESFAQQRHPAENTKAARSWAMDFETSIEFRNESVKTIKVYWLNGNAERHFLFDLQNNQSKQFKTFVSYMYLVTDGQNNSLGMYASDAQPRIIQIGGDTSVARPPRDRDNREDFDDEDYDNQRRNYDTTPVTICSNQEIPRGFVLTAVGNNFNCSNWNAVNKNTYTIQRPSLTAETTVCSSHPVPRGFVVTAAGNNFYCSNWSATGQNTYTIRRPRETETICSVSEMPRGYVITGTGNNFYCPNWSATGNNSKQIKRIR